MLKVLCYYPDDKILCPRCKGLGHHEEYDWAEYSIKDEDYHECYLCEGLGNIDWIKRVTMAHWESEELELAAAEFNGYTSGYNIKRKMSLRC